MRVYFDNAATTPLLPEVIEVMHQSLQENYGNPSSIHADGRKSRTIIENARKIIANQLNASLGEIFFTSGGTESNNMALKCAVRDLGVKRIITSPLEHHCILHTTDALEKFSEVEIILLNIDSFGTPDFQQLTSLLHDQSKKTLVSLMHGNNEIGTMIDLKEVASICEEHNALFHSDTVQTIGQYPIDVDSTKIHFLSGSAHKFHGPKGCGFVYINGETQLKPLIDGGAQERNMRAGTENIYGIRGMAEAFKLSHENRNKNYDYIIGLKNYMIEQLDAHFEDIQYNGYTDKRGMSKVLSVSFPPSPKSEMLLLNLDIVGVSASGGSACSSGVDLGSHVLTALKVDPNRKSIRFSFSQFNTKEEIDFVIEQLKKIVKMKTVKV